MKRRRPKGSAGFALTAVASVVLSASAIAYFSGAGAGEASASVTSLSAPTITKATPQAGGTVVLNWSAVSGLDSSTVKYTVLRDGGVAAGNCPNEAAAATSCTDSGVPAGEHSYVVVARWRTWSATSAPVTANVAIGAATKLSLTVDNSSPTAGTATSLTVSALDGKGNVVPTYTGSHSLTFSGAAASPGGNAPTVSNSSGTAVAFGSATALSFSAGVASVSGASNGVMKLYKSGAASISATDGSISTSSALSNLTASAGSVGTPCLFTCTVTGIGNEGTIKANVAVTDSYGNSISNLGSGHTVSVTTNGGTISGGSLTIASSGNAVSTTQFTYTSRTKGSFTDTITAATSAGTVYTGATLTAIK